MKIAFYTPTLNVGGYEKVVINYANGFSQKHQVTILCGKAEGEMKDSISSMVSVVGFGVRSRDLLRPLVKWLKKNPVDILYVPFVSFTSIAVLAKRMSGSSVLIYGVQHGFEKRNLSVIDILMGRLISKADVLAAVSETVADYDSNRLHIQRSRYYILDNPVLSTERTSNQEVKPWEDSSFTIITCGRLAKDKHIEIPIKVVSELNKRGYVIRLCILGEGSEKENLRSLARELGIEHQVVFAGFVKDTITYLECCNAYFQPSEVESFGNGVIEALYAQIPAIVTDCGGPVDIIDNGKYGINIGPYNSPDVIEKGVQAVLDIMQGKVKFEKMREKALHYDVLQLEEQFLEPYHECIKKNGKDTNSFRH